MMMHLNAHYQAFSLPLINYGKTKMGWKPLLMFLKNSSKSLHPLLHDEKCIDGGVAFQPKSHLQQTFPLLSPKPYKHPKTIKLNPNPPWMKQNY